MKIRFITSNAGKIEEARARLGPLGCEVEGARRAVTEIQADKIQEVARHKATQLLEMEEPPYFLEDAGLHIHALRDFPGVYSHYVLDTLGCDGVLRLLETAKDRSAHFLAVIAYVDAKRKVHLFEGRADGQIVKKARGTQGFGFDPIFQPDGRRQTFAELTPKEKGAVSHRGRALDALAEHLGALAKPVSRKKP